MPQVRLEAFSGVVIQSQNLWGAGIEPPASPPGWDTGTGVVNVSWGVGATGPSLLSLLPLTYKGLVTLRAAHGHVLKTLAFWNLLMTSSA